MSQAGVHATQSTVNKPLTKAHQNDPHAKARQDEPLAMARQNDPLTKVKAAPACPDGPKKSPSHKTSRWCPYHHCLEPMSDSTPVFPFKPNAALPTIAQNDSLTKAHQNEPPVKAQQNGPLTKARQNEPLAKVVKAQDKPPAARSGQTPPTNTATANGTRQDMLSQTPSPTFSSVLPKGAQQRSECSSSSSPTACSAALYSFFFLQRGLVLLL